MEEETNEDGGGGDEQEYADARRSLSLTAERSLNRFPFPHNLVVQLFGHWLYPSPLPLYCAAIKDSMASRNHNPNTSHSLLEVQSE